MSEAIDIGQITEALNDKMDRDAGNPATLGKERIVGWGMPDYTAGISKANSFTSDGYYMMYVHCVDNGTGSHTAYVEINGVKIDPRNGNYIATGGGWGAWICSFLIQPNDTVSLSKDYSSVSMYNICFPLKGV